MSMHKIPLTPIEESGLRAHGLDIGKPSQLSDAFRQGVRHASAQLPSQGGEAVEVVGVVCVSRFKNNPAMENVEFHQSADIPPGQHDLMTVAQHQRILAAATHPADQVARGVAELKALLPALDDALEDLELHGRHSDQGCRKLKDWYRKAELITDRIDGAHCVAGQSAEPDAELVELLRSKFPRIDPCQPVPLDEKAHCCEYTIYVERERLHRIIDAKLASLKGVEE